MTNLNYIGQKPTVAKKYTPTNPTPTTAVIVAQRPVLAGKNLQKSLDKMAAPSGGTTTALKIAQAGGKAGIFIGTVAIGVVWGIVQTGFELICILGKEIFSSNKREGNRHGSRGGSSVNQNFQMNNCKDIHIHNHFGK